MIKRFQYGKLAERKVCVLKADARIRHGCVRGTGQFDVCIQSAFFVTVAFRVPAHSEIKLTAKNAKNAKKIIKNSLFPWRLRVFGGNEFIGCQSVPGGGEHLISPGWFSWSNPPFPGATCHRWPPGPWPLRD